MTVPSMAAPSGCSAAVPFALHPRLRTPQLGVAMLSVWRPFARCRADLQRVTAVVLAGRGLRIGLRSAVFGCLSFQCPLCCVRACVRACVCAELWRF